MAKIGIIGLGMMGSRMAGRWLGAGHTVAGFNRTRAKAEPLIRAGLQWAATPRRVAESSEFTFSMVSNSAALRAIFEGSDGVLAGLSPGKTYVDMSTVSPQLSQKLAAAAAAKGADMLDAPVSGSPPMLAQGNVSIMVGGDAEAFERVKPLLLELGPKVIHLGGNGLACLMKIAVNLHLSIQLIALSESVLLAEKGGIARETALDVVLNSVAASPAMKYRGPFILHMPEEAWFDIGLMQKDIQLALEVGRDLAVPTFTAGLSNEMLTAARALGLEKQDFAALFQVVERLAGGSVGVEDGA